MMTSSSVPAAVAQQAVLMLLAAQQQQDNAQAARFSAFASGNQAPRLSSPLAADTVQFSSCCR